MKIKVISKTKARKPGVKRIDDSSLEVAVHEAPIDGKANLAIIKSLAKYFALPKSRITFLSGQTSKYKYFQIDR
jgi:uncharacterized protein